MTALDGGPHGVTETAAAHCDSRFRTTDGYSGFVATYCLSILQAFADGHQPATGETAQEYAQRHLALMQEHGYVEQKTEVPA